MTDDRVYEVIDEMENMDQGVEQSPDHILLSSGVVLKAKRVPPVLFQKINTKFKLPPVPVLWNEEKGRKEENYQHPAYLAAVKDIQDQQTMANMEALAGLGTDIVDVPDDMPLPDNREWSDEMAAFYPESIPTSGRGRYLAWLSLIAITDVSDLVLIAQAVQTKMGVTNDQVAQEMSRFRSDEI